MVVQIAPATESKPKTHKKYGHNCSALGLREVERERVSVGQREKERGFEFGFDFEFAKILVLEIQATIPSTYCFSSIQG